MGPFLFNSFSDGPVMALPPQDPPSLQFPSQQFQGASTNRFQTHVNSQFSMNGSRYTAPLSKPRVSQMHQTSWNQGSSHTAPNLNRSRKRSRDEADIVDEPVPEPVNPAPVAPARQEEPIYGEGMVLLNPRTKMAVSAESQTGTWYEEKSEDVTASNAPVLSAAVPQRSDSLSAQGRKLQRLDASAPGLDDIAIASIGKKIQSTGQDEDNHRKNKLSHSSSFSPEEPLVDDFTHILGISWQRVESGDADMAAAIRGWARYIDNHYSTYIRDSKILLKHKGLNAYLVAGQSPVPDMDMSGNGTQQVFYLFNENLCGAQLVARNWEACLQNLRSVPIAFEDSHVITAIQWTPERVVEDKGVLVESVNSDGSSEMLGGGAGHDADAGMGMDIDS